MHPLTTRYWFVFCVFTLWWTWGCGTGTGSSTRLTASDYDQTCLDVTQCALVDMEACGGCECADTAISQEAYQAYRDDQYQLQQVHCPDEEEPASCPNCDLREPSCYNEVCQIN